MPVHLQFLPHPSVPSCQGETPQFPLPTSDPARQDSLRVTPLPVLHSAPRAPLPDSHLALSSTGPPATASQPLWKWRIPRKTRAQAHYSSRDLLRTSCHFLLGTAHSRRERHCRLGSRHTCARGCRSPPHPASGVPGQHVMEENQADPPPAGSQLDSCHNSSRAPQVPQFHTTSPLSLEGP